MAVAQQSAQERILPRNVDAERAVLGAMLKDRDAANSGLSILIPESFYERPHQHIFRAVQALFQRGEALDLHTLHAELVKSGKIDDVGGPAYLRVVLTSVATSANIEHHARLVHEKALVRNLIRGCTELVDRGYDDSEDAGNLVGEAERLILHLSQQSVQGGLVQVRQTVEAVMDEIEEAHRTQKGTVGLSTGYPDLDALTSGLRPSDLIILAARPSVGKTAFALNLMTNIAMDSKDEKKHAVAFFSIEQDRESIIRRLLCARARVQGQSLQTGRMSSRDLAKLAQSASQFLGAPIYLDDTSGIRLHELTARARRLAFELQSTPTPLGLIIIDYLQLVQGESERGRPMEGRQQEVALISRSLKALARELRVPVIAISQLSRAIEKRDDPTPKLSDLRESGALEQDADLVAFVHRNPRKKFTRVGEEAEEEATPDDDSVDDTRAKLIIGKQRNGPIGTVDLYYIEQYMRFESRAKAPPPMVSDAPF